MTRECPKMKSPYNLRIKFKKYSKLFIFMLDNPVKRGYYMHVDA